MILECIRMVADALSSATYGVNTHLATLVLDGSDTRPTNIAVIADETRNNQVAIGRYPTTLPALVVTLEGSTPIDGDVVSDTREGEVSILIRYLSKNVETATGNSDTYYIIRAIQRCLADLCSNIYENDRVRNGIQLIDCLSIEHQQIFENIADAYITGGIKATFKVRDVQP